jgi:hypothetical protein
MGPVREEPLRCGLPQGEVQVPADVVRCERLRHELEPRLDGRFGRCVVGRAHREQRERAGEGRQRAVVRCDPSESAARVADLDGDERRARLRAGDRDERVDRLGRQRSEEAVVGAVRYRVARVHVQGADPGGRHRRESGERWSELAERSQQRRAVGLIAEIDRFDERERAAAKRLGDVRQRREAEDPANRRDLVRRRLGPFPPRVEHFRRALPGEEERARIHVRERVEPELDRGDDAEAAAAAAERPEELRLVFLVDAAQPPVGRDQLDRDDAVRREAELPPIPAQAAAQRVADHRHVRRRAVEGGEAELGRLRNDVGPARGRADAGDFSGGVDGDSLEGVRLQEDRVVECA